MIRKRLIQLVAQLMYHLQASREASEVLDKAMQPYDELYQELGLLKWASKKSIEEKIEEILKGEEE